MGLSSNDLTEYYQILNINVTPFEELPNILNKLNQDESKSVGSDEWRLRAFVILSFACSMPKLAETILAKLHPGLRVKIVLQEGLEGSSHVVDWSFDAASMPIFKFNNFLSDKSSVGAVDRWLDTRCYWIDVCRRGGFSRSVLWSLGDIGEPDTLNFCCHTASNVLIPNSEFFRTRGHDSYRRLFRQNRTAWARRRTEVMWRGSTTGLITTNRSRVDAGPAGQDGYV